MSNGNVHFMGVARFQGGVVVASYSYNSKVNLEGVKQLLAQPDLRINSGQHYSFAVENLAWHLIMDIQSRVFILITSDNYPRRVVVTALDELMRTFVDRFGSPSLTAVEGGLNRPASSYLQTLCEKYDDLNRIDALSAVQSKVESVQLIMEDNVQAALSNCVKLENIEQKAQELQDQAGVFKRNARQVQQKMWWKDLKMKLILAAIVIVVLLIIIIPLVIKFSN